jgi:hypothetical protein
MDKTDKVETRKPQETNVKALRDDQLEAVTGGALSNAFSQVIKAVGDGLRSMAQKG